MKSGSFWWMGMVWVCVCAGCQSTHVNVIKQGALGDGKKLNTAAFQTALDACQQTGGGVVEVPAGNYLIGSIVMSSNTTLKLDKGATLIGSPNPDDYPLMQVRWEGRWRDGHRALIHAKDAQHIALVGEGTINGDMKVGNLRNPRGPCIFEPISCKDVRIEGISINYRRMWACHLTYCENVVARGLKIRSTM
ncbi:MAG TPA: glycosyl hydrolase family 28-related protein, partial [Tepidisphaeraceae bacterium]|nr:glycosyl hydrolase family 28-related protein [Tepidisphaeraceae bacterium]